jgi:hypothetical protein
MTWNTAPKRPRLAETLREAEEEIGIANWMDPDTGEPAEEQPPHLAES